MTKLAIVESPAKAKTISSFLGSEWTVLASYGHIRDLPDKGLGVDVDNHFKPTYEVRARKDVLSDIKSAMKDADELFLATDEDREGEAIAWHLNEVLKPRIPVKRMVFHEITRSAIDRAVDESRDIDYRLVDAQESRRIVDRLVGFEISPVLWRKIGQSARSAGRVQSPAVRLVVERERERMAFVSAGYWDLAAQFRYDEAEGQAEPSFKAALQSIDGARIASGKDFDQAGVAKTGVVVLDEPAARGLVSALDDSTFTVRSVESKESKQRPKPPFITSSLQQVGGSRLRMSARQVMQVAQGLYERGYITYMRTDSTTLSGEALATARRLIETAFGRDHLPDAPRLYAKKAKGAQEAHEAIRPAGDAWRTPEQLDGELRGHDLSLYRIIYQRTLASQMVDARLNTVTVKIDAPAAAPPDGATAVRKTEWSASGRTIVFPGFLAVYGFSGEDSDDDDESDARLPQLAEGDQLSKPELTADGHTTQPPSRYTEATLVKALEDLGIGRPSTYASIMSTIQDRGYVFKKGTALVPTSSAFAVTNLLTQYFSHLVDFDFTAKMEDDLDAIAEGTQQREPWLQSFYFGNGTPGLHPLVQVALDEADPAVINAIPLGMDEHGEPIELRNGKFGPYVRRGEDTASVPPDLPMDELTIDRAVEFLNAPKGTDPIGEDPETGLPVYAKSGRYGPYVQLGDPETLPPKQKPKMASLFKDMALETLTLDDALKLLTLPRVVGEDPADGVAITAQNGKFGPYITKDKDSRSLESEQQLFDLTLEQALALLAQPKQYGRRGAPKPPLRELGEDTVSGNPMVLKEGRFGPYVTDGETNASLRAGDTVEEITPDRAMELLQIRRDAGPAKKKAPAKKAPAKKKAAAAKKKTAKKEPMVAKAKVARAIKGAQDASAQHSSD